MRYHFLLLCLLLCLTIPLHAQDDPSPYDIALQRIQEAAETEAIRLDLSELGLTELPLELWQLSNLQMLYLWGNQLTSVPPEIGRLSNLQELSLSYNQLTSVPSEIWQLSNLQL